MAVELVARFLKKPARLEHLTERFPQQWDMGNRRACQSLLFGTVRNLKFLERVLDGFLKKRPKPGVWAALLVASRELMEAPEKRAQVVHHAVGFIGSQYSGSEKGLANAVLRKVPDRLRELSAVEVSSAPDLAWRYSHPQWLVERWLVQFGLEATRAFLEWNQREPETFFRWQKEPESNSALEASRWDGYYRLKRASWEEVAPLLDAGKLYVQNPAARLAPDLLVSAFGGGRALDLCAAPGGKSLYLEQQLGETLQEVVAVDLPGPRFERMRQNAARSSGGRLTLLPADLQTLDVSETGLFEAVLLDAPCSNTGVLQHKLDVRWRLTAGRLEELKNLQCRYLLKAAAFVAAKGALVYSTCSVERDENAEVVERFLSLEVGRGFRLEATRCSYPWEDGHDGAGAFLLRRV